MEDGTLMARVGRVTTDAIVWNRFVRWNLFFPCNPSPNIFKEKSSWYYQWKEAVTNTFLPGSYFISPRAVERKFM